MGKALTELALEEFMRKMFTLTDKQFIVVLALLLNEREEPNDSP